jgi:hypothetical protein
MTIAKAAKNRPIQIRNETALTSPQVISKTIAAKMMIALIRFMVPQF